MKKVDGSVGSLITAYSDAAGMGYEAIQIPWRKVRAILGREHEGSAEDDQALVRALQLAGAPAWVKGAQGWTDEHGWGLIGPVIGKA